MAEVGIAVAESGLSRSECNEIVRVLLRRYAATLREPRMGRPFPELYDPKAATPREWWSRLHERVRREIGEVTGLPLDRAAPQDGE